jgi:hypothetical protein
MALAMMNARSCLWTIQCTLPDKKSVIQPGLDA